jgi:LysM repeat protein
MLHHTGAFSTVNQMAELLWNGYAGLPGPLCHGGIDPAGIIRLTGWGRANHAGLGSLTTLDAVRASKYPATGNLKPGKATEDGNKHFYGFEIMADGQTPITDAQRITAVKISAALCLEHKWGPDVIGHGEWQQGKWDVGAHGKLIDFSKVRSEVKQAMKEGPKKPTPKPPTTTPKPKTKEITIAQGDTFYSLARKYFPRAETSDEAVTDLVNMNPNLLQVGKKLIVPNP